MRRWKILQSTYLVRHPMVNIRQDACELPQGRTIDDYFVVEEPDVVLVFALTTDQKLILVEQYKHGIQETCLEIPGGYLDDANEDPLEAARRELIEETGYQVDELTPLATFVNQPTRCTNRTFVYIGTNGRRVADQNLDENEDIHIRLVDMSDVFRMIREGQISVALSVGAIYMAWERINTSL